MRRRDFIAGAMGIAGAPRRAPAQRRAMPLVVYFTGLPLNDRPKMLDAMRDGLAKQGYRSGETFSMELVSTDGRESRIREIAEEIIARGPVLVIVNTPAPARAFTQLTQSVPVVFITGADPVKLGLVSSINRPGGNVTGISFLAGDLNPKRLQLLREIAPRIRRVAVMANPTNPIAEPQIADVERAGRDLDLQLTVLRARSDGEIAAALEQIAERNVDALLVNADPFLTARRGMILRFVAQKALPAMYPLREWADDGGLISYGTSINAAHRLAGEYAGRILKGETAGELPVQQSTHFELVINAKTARSLGLEVPLVLLATANEVIE